MKHIIALFLLCLSSITYSFHHMAYVEVNDHALSNVACFVHQDSGQPYFDIAGLFAANINGDSPNQPEIFFNPQVQQTLNHTQAVAKLHAKGIKVVLTLLGNHHNAGWSCMTDPKAAKQFAKAITDTLNHYDLDGVDIDDEYSKCTPNHYSMIMIAKALKEEPSFQGKLLTKALWQDSSIFKANYQGYKLADFLDYGWEMGYGNGGPEYRLAPYQRFGMTQSQLMLGLKDLRHTQTSVAWLKQTRLQGYGGMMFFNLHAQSGLVLNAFSKAENLSNIIVNNGCLS